MVAADPGSAQSVSEKIVDCPPIFPQQSRGELRVELGLAAAEPVCRRLQTRVDQSRGENRAKVVAGAEGTFWRHDALGSSFSQVNGKVSRIEGDFETYFLQSCQIFNFLLQKFNSFVETFRRIAFDHKRGN